MMIDPFKQYQSLLPLVCEWVKGQETIILRKGDPLPQDLLQDAGLIGIKHPERVRTLLVPSIALPENPTLRKACRQTGLISSRTAAITMRYGIFIRAERAHDRRLAIHELVHVSQYENLGGILAFLRRYLFEIVAVGYPNGPLEQEAARVADRLCLEEKVLEIG